MLYQPRRDGVDIQRFEVFDDWHYGGPTVGDAALVDRLLAGESKLDRFIAAHKLVWSCTGPYFVSLLYGPIWELTVESVGWERASHQIGVTLLPSHASSAVQFAFVRLRSEPSRLRLTGVYTTNDPVLGPISNDDFLARHQILVHRKATHRELIKRMIEERALDSGAAGRSLGGDNFRIRLDQDPFDLTAAEVDVLDAAFLPKTT